MLKKHSQFLESLVLLGDLVVIAAAWLVSYFLRFRVGPVPVYFGVPPLTPYLVLLGAVLVIWPVAFKGLGLYRPRRIASHLGEIWDIAKASSLATLLVIALTFFYRSFEFSRVFFLYFWILSVAGVTFVRAAFRELLRIAQRRGYNLRAALVVGAGASAASVIQRIHRHPELGIQIRGVLAEDASRIGEDVEGVPIVGTYDQAGRFVDEQRVDVLFVALPLEASVRVGDILKDLGDAAVAIKVIPDFSRFVTLRGGFEAFEGLPIISLQDSPLYGWNVVLKRVADVVLASVVLLVAAPLMTLIALIVRCASPGPVFYIQERMGLDGRVFRMLKFRSMRLGAEDKTGPVWARAGDPRVTRIGRWLRRTSLDELPQLINVLKGEMSLVGPRPERPELIESFRRTIPRYMLRHKMKAGMTGWAQINGWRGNTSLEKRIEYDLYYIENWSLLFDLWILWLTVWRGFVHKDAY